MLTNFSLLKNQNRSSEYRTQSYFSSIVTNPFGCIAVRNCCMCFRGKLKIDDDDDIHESYSENNILDNNYINSINKKSIESNSLSHYCIGNEQKQEISRLKEDNKQISDRVSKLEKELSDIKFELIKSNLTVSSFFTKSGTKCKCGNNSKEIKQIVDLNKEENNFCEKELERDDIDNKTSTDELHDFEII